jgi:hypothetical protein
VLGGPVQIAYAVADVRAAAEAWTATGVGPFFVREHIPLTNVRIRGVPATFDHSSAFAWWGDLMVELIQQHDGGAEPVVGGRGIHHMAHFVDDFSAAAAALVEAGYPQVLYAEAGTTGFAFHDAIDERSHLIEIYERSGGLGAFYDMVREASIGWDGSDPFRTL